MAQVERIAAERDAVQVTLIRLRVGPLSGVEPELLRQAFPIASAGTLAEGCRLEITQPPLRVRCLGCGAETEARANRLVCGACGDWHTELVAGDEMLLERMELELAETAPAAALN
jgi:hydrogenase nickel incorporation protein HypA/HybF